jgi:hypothetical protein
MDKFKDFLELVKDYFTTQLAFIATGFPLPLQQEIVAFTGCANTIRYHWHTRLECHHATQHR